MKDFRSNLKIIEDISGSTCCSKLVALGSSWVAVGFGQKSTATTFFYLKSISYAKGSRVALVFIQAHKTRFLPLFGTFLTTKTALVAVVFLLKIFSFQAVSIDKKCNCYHLSIRAEMSWFALIRFLGSCPVCSINHRKNSLYVVVNKFVDFRFIGLLVKVLSALCDMSRLWCFFNGSEIKPEKAKLVTAHNYKKCDRQVLGSNKINELQIVDFKKSVVRFGLVDCLGSVRGLATLPPIENSESQQASSHLLLAINWRDFIRVFYMVLWLLYMVSRMFGFRKGRGPGKP